MYFMDATRVLKTVWVKWDVRGLMLVSLCLQTLLLLFAPLRKRRSSNWLIGSLLCIYLLADWAANYAAGVITSSDCSGKNNQPLAFWSTFLMVHLGGPDSITAFVLQDNEFWDRHTFALVFQCISAAYTFFQTLNTNPVWLPTLLMFACGFIKYCERAMSLYFACFDTLRDSLLKREPDPGTDYAQIMDVYRWTREAGLPTRIEMIEAPERTIRWKEGRLNEREVVLYAYQFFLTFKRLLVDLECSYDVRKQSRKFFLCREVEEAFRVIEVELEFMYDVLFTKANVVYNRIGFLRRLFSSALVAVSFGLFYYEEKRFKASDISITYALLAGAIGLDVIAYYQLITSNWFTLLTTEWHNDNWPLPTHQSQPTIQPVKMRSVPTYNLFDYCLRPPQNETQYIMNRSGLKRFFDGLWYVKREAFTEDLRKHIFKEVKRRSQWAEYVKSFKEAITARGDWILRLEVDFGGLLRRYVEEMDYDQSLLSWHIATELCWCKEVKEIEGEKLRNQKKNSKLLSDYMMYLVTMQPEIMYGVTDIAKVRLRDTCAELGKVASTCPYLHPNREETPSTFTLITHVFLCCSRAIVWSIKALLSPLYIITLPRPAYKKYDEPAVDTWEKPSEEHVALCTKILGVNTEVDPVCIKGNRSKSVLFHGCRLAKELEELGNRKWEIMSKVWVEMLTYAAVQCRPRTLAEELSKGGELISYVWLLMAHFGLVDHFDFSPGVCRAKLITEK